MNLRRHIIVRDQHTCAWCGCLTLAPHVDHIWPISLGGGNEQSNLVTSCPSCNLSKGARVIPREWMPRRMSGWLYDQFDEPYEDRLPGEMES